MTARQRLRVRYRSVRCDGDFADPAEYATLDDARHAIRSLSQVYWQAVITDDEGNQLVRACRSGRNATGKRWIFTGIRD